MTTQRIQLTGDFSDWLTPFQARRVTGGIKREGWIRMAEQGEVIAIKTPKGWLIEPSSAERAKREVDIELRKLAAMMKRSAR